MYSNLQAANSIKKILISSSHSEIRARLAIKLSLAYVNKIRKRPSKVLKLLQF